MLERTKPKMGTGMRRVLLVLCLLATPAMGGGPASAPLLNTDKTVIGQPIEAPAHPTVIATIVTFQPGDKTDAHKHLYPHYGYMLEGTLTIVNTQTGKSFELKPGAFLVEMIDTWHYGENRGTVPVKMLIVDTVPAGVKINVVAQP
jgi:quercetin dioxygenase-like cupin family protein